MGNQDEAIDLCPISWLNKWTYMSRTMVNTQERRKVEFFMMLMLMFFSIAMELFSKDKNNNENEANHSLKSS